MKRWRLVREDVLGMRDFAWNRESQREQHLTGLQIKRLEAGEIVRTASRGGSEFYLVAEAEVSTIICPHCGGEVDLPGGPKEEKEKLA